MDKHGSYALTNAKSRFRPDMVSTLDKQVEPRATRQICGNDFDSMYFAGACDLGRKRSAWPPLGPVEPQFQLYYPTSDWESVPADLGRLENSLVHRLARSVWFGQQRPRPRLTPASARHPVWKHQRASKRSPAHYRRLHDL
ncbi:hypothetical protein FJT64_003994 [Amphibalanus amphitrite]|uniref:Uncharacterized protein n=1 Tax=Amphibalanus amphitrite TaxID=1232801 RepID=A0A6A4VY94_AMPAM|nr:hypothetical protein FJT64_003994 [Amphibalanus amphitrite]